MRVAVVHRTNSYWLSATPWLLLCSTCAPAEERDTTPDIVLDSDTPAVFGPADLQSGPPRASRSVSHIPTPGIEPGCQVPDCCPAGLSIVIGDAGSNQLTGGSGAQCLVGLGGNDHLISGSATDILFGGEGDDVLHGGSAADVISAGEGNDQIVASSGHDRIHGGEGDDHIDAGSGDDSVACGAGDDWVDGHTGDDEIDAGAGNDAVWGGAGDDLLVGGPGLDLVHAGPGADKVVILDACEIAVGEVYDGGSGVDTLVTPVDLATLAALGVTVENFENIEVDTALGLQSACGGCGCAITGNQIECCGGHGQCEVVVSDAFVCSCDADFAGDDCSIACDAGSGCVAQTYRNGDSTILGVSLAGDVFFPATDPAGAVAALRVFVASHAGLFKLAPIAASDLNGIDFVETLEFAGLTLHRYDQRYRGIPIHGAGTQISLLAAGDKGVIAVRGEIVDPRVDYAGTAGALLSEAMAAAAIEQGWELRFPNSLPTAGEVTLVAVPTLKTLAYRASVTVEGVTRGSALVAAAAAENGKMLGLFDGSDVFTGEIPIVVRAEKWELFPFVADSDADADNFTDYRTGGGEEVIEGIEVAVEACGGTPNCYLLADDKRHYIYDRNGMPLDEGLTGAYVVPASSVPSFTEAGNTNPFRLQNHLHRIGSAMRAVASTMACRWDWGPTQGMGKCTEPVVLSLANNNTTRFAGRYRSPEMMAPLLLEGGKLNETWTARFLDLKQNSDGDEVAPGGIELVGKTGTRTSYHEFGHHLDWFSSHGAGGIVGNLLSLYVPAPGCATPETGCCTQDTPDEAMALAETVGQLWAYHFARKLHSEIPQAAPVTLVEFALAHAPNGNSLFTFKSDRPKNDVHPATGCHQQAGYGQRAVVQAFWEFSDGIDCGPDPGMPDVCPALTPALGPGGVPVPHVDVGGQALQYALARQPPSGGYYQMLFDDMGEYIECVYGPAVFEEFKGIFAHHGIMVFAPQPRVCPQICGNGKREAPETCDGPDLGGADCTSLGSPGGSLSCTPACEFDVSGCSVCGNGIMESGEDCDGEDFAGLTCADVTAGALTFGPLLCTPDCLVETTACANCEPGSVGCRCRDTHLPGEENSLLPAGGIFGDGRYCLDDVSRGGFVRCEDPPGAEPARCVPCGGTGTWCPCVEMFQACDPSGFEGPATGSGTGTCEGACATEDGQCSGALGHGYCFVAGESDPMQGGMPAWFLDNYCSIKHEEFVCVQEPGLNKTCAESGTSCQ